MKMNDKLINFLAENKTQAVVNDKGEAIGFSDNGNRLIYLNTEKKWCAIPSVIAEHDETWTLLHRDDLKMLNNKNETPRNTGKLELGENTIWFSPEQLIIQTNSISLVKEAIEIWVKNVESKR